jgi:UDP-N-acetylglucosamine 4,6-dehydratase/5-epimerase
MQSSTTTTAAAKRSVYSGATILITGGTGSIGGELLRTLLTHRPKKVVVFSNDENGLFETRSKIGVRPDVDYRLGDVRDMRGLDSAMSGCDYVFHAAALKHVTFCEVNPYEAISTNTLGTQNVIDSAIRNRVKKFVFISTDKSVNPINTLGATKLLAEKLVISASQQGKSPVFSIVRFGNVVGSRGSVVLIFERQVREGGPITITDPEMTRYIMAPSQASALILKAGEAARPGEIFVLKMRAIRMRDLADACRTFFSERFGRDPRKVRIKRIGRQPGEKDHEELMNETEVVNAVESGDFFIIKPDQETRRRARSIPTHARGLSSRDVPPINRNEIISELSELYPEQPERHA